MQRLRGPLVTLWLRWALTAMSSDNIISHFQGAFQMYVYITSLSLGPRPIAMKAQPLSKSHSAQCHNHRLNEGSGSHWILFSHNKKSQCYSTTGFPCPVQSSGVVDDSQWRLLYKSVTGNRLVICSYSSCEILMAKPSRHLWVTRVDLKPVKMFCSPLKNYIHSLHPVSAMYRETSWTTPLCQFSKYLVSSPKPSKYLPFSGKPSHHSTVHRHHLLVSYHLCAFWRLYS